MALVAGSDRSFDLALRVLQRYGECSGGCLLSPLGCSPRGTLRPPSHFASHPLDTDMIGKSQTTFPNRSIVQYHRNQVSSQAFFFLAFLPWRLRRIVSLSYSATVLRLVLWCLTSVPRSTCESMTPIVSLPTLTLAHFP